MYILKNAWTSIKRNKGRNILIGIIILVISICATVTLAINNSSNKLIESYQSKYQVEATIGINRENMMKDFNPEDMDSSKENVQDMFSAANSIDVKDIDNYGDSKYVKSYYYTISAGANSSDIEKASMSVENEDNNEDNKKQFEGFGPNQGDMQGMNNISNGDFTIKGYSSIEAMNEFIEGSYKITSGEVSEDFDSNDCLINSELATVNDLEVGDTITITDPDDDDITYTLTIKGIFEEETENDNMMNMFSNSANTIITNANFAQEMKENNDDLNISITPTFVLTSKDVIDKFSSELTEKGLDENLTVQTNLDQVENSTSTISNVKTFSTTFLIITLIIGTVVLLVINMINIRERKYEIGVLRTIGMKKRNVSFQFLLELLIVSFAFLILGAGIGASISMPVSNALLQNEITSSATQQNDIRQNFGKPDIEENSNQTDSDKKDTKSFSDNKFNGVANIQAFDSIDATVDFVVIIKLLLIGLGITLVSSISAMASIQRFSPLTILKERS